MFTKLIDAVRSYLHARESELALKGLSEAALDDLGLTRASIAGLYARPVPVQAKPTLVFDPFALNLAFPATAQAA